MVNQRQVLVCKFLLKDCLRNILASRAAAIEVLDFQKTPI